MDHTSLPPDHLRPQLTPLVDHRQNEDTRVLDLVENSVGIKRQLADRLAAKFRHHRANAGQLIEYIGLGYDVLGDLLGVVRGIVGDEVMNGT
jgi:hypothetical protein